MKHLRYQDLIVTAADAGRSVHDLMKNELCISEALISRLKRRAAGITIDNQKVYTTYRVKAGERLVCEVGDAPDFPAPVPMPYPLPVLYEDEDYIIIDKPNGLSVHASTRELNALTLENALAAYLPQGENPHPVSRLDRGTTGVITFAKSGFAHELLRQKAHTTAYQREYRALVHGCPCEASGRIDAPIGFYPGSGYRRAVTENGQSAISDYERLATTGDLSLVRLVPQTGRTHQLRVHMAHLGHPLLGDWLYGKEEREIIARPALHSYRLLFTHPLTQKTIEIVAPLPQDMRTAMEQAGDWVVGAE